MKKLLLTFGTLLLFVTPQAYTAGIQTCEHFLIRGLQTRTTTLTGTTAKVQQYPTIDTIDVFDRSGEWAESSGNDAEFCWTPTDPRDKGTFRVSYSGSVIAHQSSGNLILSIGQDTGPTIGSGDELTSSIQIIRVGLDAEDDIVHVVAISDEMETGGCFGLLLDSTVSAAVIDTDNWTFEVVQLTDQNGRACQP